LTVISSQYRSPITAYWISCDRIQQLDDDVDQRQRIEGLGEVTMIAGRGGALAAAFADIRGHGRKRQSGCRARIDGVSWIRAAVEFVGAMMLSTLPERYWQRAPAAFPMAPAAFAAGLVFFFAGAALGISGYFEHTARLVSDINDLTLKAAADQIAAGIKDGDPREIRFGTPNLVAFSLFTFLLMTPKGWLTLYLLGSGAFRAIASSFDDPFGDPVLTVIDNRLLASGERKRLEREARTRLKAEGPELPDRIVTSTAAGIPGCDMVIVSTRRKPGWERGATVFTAEAAYRIGEPVERTIAGRLRTLYPLTEHKDFEAVRKSVHYDLPVKAGHDGAADEEPRTTADRSG
jgi:hypothetical protein